MCLKFLWRRPHGGADYRKCIREKNKLWGPRWLTYIKFKFGKSEQKMHRRRLRGRKSGRADKNCLHPTLGGKINCGQKGVKRRNQKFRTCLKEYVNSGCGNFCECQTRLCNCPAVCPEMKRILGCKQCRGRWIYEGTQRCQQKGRSQQCQRCSWKRGFRAGRYPARRFPRGYAGLLQMENPKDRINISSILKKRTDNSSFDVGGRDNVAALDESLSSKRCR